MSLDPNESVTIRLPTYHLTLINSGCTVKSAAPVVVMLDKMKYSIRIGLRIMCGPKKDLSEETS